MLVLEMLSKRVQKRMSVSTPSSFSRTYTLEEKAIMKNFLARLWKDEQGQDLTEYALLLVLLTLAAIGSLSTLATAVNGVFQNAAANLTTPT
jgi:Flp pilus assembly pilin Flp